MEAIKEKARIFSEQDLVRILTDAGKEQEVTKIRANNKREEKVAENLTRRFGIDNLEGITQEIIYELADTLEIERGHIDEILRTRYPTIEEQKTAIERYGAEPTKELKRKMNIIDGIAECNKQSVLVRDYKETLKKLIEEYSYLEKFGTKSERDFWALNHYPCTSFFSIYRWIEKEKGIFIKKKKIFEGEQVLRVDFKFYSAPNSEDNSERIYSSKVLIDTPQRLVVCGETLETLAKKYELKQEIAYCEIPSQ